ncbi:MAG: hypothetical protein BZY68_00795 [SAR202 cluster bacterium MP-SAtl-SRR3965592-G2]|nr:MAG: hypothetical protein BZY68_00795 [SAR202 cluster bacterium MP-SAtl-SRR3965592-G2]PKB77451.1 MAG: hypothetical protein BZY70_02805 [SAR202 cluster bacterium MP-SInd-SRR3963457-G2]
MAAREISEAEVLEVLSNT